MIKVRKHHEEIKISPGDLMDFIAIRWTEPCWQFDFPSALIYPVFNVYENAKWPETVIEDALINVSVFKGELKSDQDIWRCNPDYIRRIARGLLNGNCKIANTHSRYAAVLEKYRFFWNEKKNFLDAELWCRASG